MLLAAGKGVKLTGVGAGAREEDCGEHAQRNCFDGFVHANGPQVCEQQRFRLLTCSYWYSACEGFVSIAAQAAHCPACGARTCLVDVGTLRLQYGLSLAAVSVSTRGSKVFLCGEGRIVTGGSVMLRVAVSLINIPSLLSVLVSAQLLCRCCIIAMCAHKIVALCTSSRWVVR
jgi:hypothetical protein